MTYPSVFPTGTTIYDPRRCWSGYTLFQAKEVGALLIDMNGAEVQLWQGLHGLPNLLLPGGQVLGSSGERNPRFGKQDYVDVIQVDWDGNVVWRFDRFAYIEDPGEPSRWMARQHHDLQREGSPCGYFAPGLSPRCDGGNTLILGHRNIQLPEISDQPLLDDVIYEVNWQGEIVWRWACSDHFAAYGFSESARSVLRQNPNLPPTGGGPGDWMHLNAMAVLGPNRWHDAGDDRFRPDNIIWSAREANIIAIVDKRSGEIVWQLGPEYTGDDRFEALGWIIGQHHAHMIPRGLPGEGHILVFDNGGWAGYGSPGPSAPTGNKNARRDYSRVLEIDPTTLEIAWQYTPKEIGLVQPMDSNRFYSPFVSSAQRLPNGNTMIAEGSGGRVIEVTPNHDIVWEYISPYWGRLLPINMIYRACRVPYDWVPQLDPPRETPVKRIDPSGFRVPGAAPPGPQRTVKMAGMRPYSAGSALCVLPSSGKS